MKFHKKIEAIHILYFIFGKFICMVQIIFYINQVVKFFGRKLYIILPNYFFYIDSICNEIPFFSWVALCYDLLFVINLSNRWLILCIILNIRILVLLNHLFLFHCPFSILLITILIFPPIYCEIKNDVCPALQQILKDIL